MAATRTRSSPGRVIHTAWRSHGSHLYWASAGTGVAGVGAIWAANLDGSGAHAIVTGQNDPLAVAAAGTHLYWTNSAGNAAGAGSVWAANLDGSGAHAIVTGQNAPLGVAADGSHLYWANVLDQAVEEANLDGTSPHPIVTGLGDLKLMAITPPPAALAFTPSPFDYGQVATGQPASQTFTLANTGGQATGALTDTLTGAAAFTVTGDTCTGTSLGAGATCTVTVRFAPASIAAFSATLTSASANPAATATVALSGTGVAPRFLYWTDFGSNSDSSNGTVNQAGLGGTSPHAIATAQNQAAGIAVSASRIYWSTSGNTINEANLDGTSPRAVPVIGVGQIAVDASNLYWTHEQGGLNGGTIIEAGLDVTGPHAIVTGQPFLIVGLAADASHVYWTSETDFSNGHGSVWEANLDGSSAHAIVTGQNDPNGVAVGGGHVYWAAAGAGPGFGAIWEANPDGSERACHRHRPERPQRGRGRCQPRLLGQRRLQRHLRGQSRRLQRACHRHRPALRVRSRGQPTLSTWHGDRKRPAGNMSRGDREPAPPFRSESDSGTDVDRPHRSSRRRFGFHVTGTLGCRKVHPWSTPMWRPSGA